MKDETSSPIQTHAFKIETTVKHESIPIVISDSDTDSDVATSSIRITKNLTVDTLKTLTAVPSCWVVPKPGESFAYLLDLRNDSRIWVKDGEPMNMAAIIKAEVSCSNHCNHPF